MKTFRQFIEEDAAQSPPAIIHPAPAGKEDHIGGLIRRMSKPDSIAALLKKHEDREKEFEGFAHRTFKYEGPAGKVTHDTGGMTRYGISKNAHPDVDIANLTKDDAKEIYRKHYFEGMGELNHLSHRSRAVVLDAAINQGKGFAQKLAKEHGDNYDKLIQGRKDHYDHLATSNPDKYGKYHKGWLNRLDKLRNDTQELK